MKQGISLHIGLNTVDPAAYDGWDGALEACEFDAKDMADIARKKRFASSKLLLTKAATVANVTAGILDAAGKLKAGDLFLLTYSGHGGQVPDTNGDETDGDRKDETWVLYDRMLVDDELYFLWSKFARGVRILVLSDSCHSGSVVKAMRFFLDLSAAAKRQKRGKPKFVPPDVSRAAYAADRTTYDDIQKRLAGSENAAVKGSVLLISGCQDNQVSYDGPRNGKFTAALRRVWNSGRFAGTYKTFHSKIQASIAEYQSPNYFKTGAANPAFENQVPFTI